MMPSLIAPRLVQHWYNYCGTALSAGMHKSEKSAWHRPVNDRLAIFSFVELAHARADQACKYFVMTIPAFLSSIGEPSLAEDTCQVPQACISLFRQGLLQIGACRAWLAASWTSEVQLGTVHILPCPAGW